MRHTYRNYGYWNLDVHDGLQSWCARWNGTRQGPYPQDRQAIRRVFDQKALGHYPILHEPSVSAEGDSDQTNIYNLTKEILT